MSERHLFTWNEVELLCGSAEKERKHWIVFS